MAGVYPLIAIVRKSLNASRGFFGRPRPRAYMMAKRLTASRRSRSALEVESASEMPASRWPARSPDPVEAFCMTSCSEPTRGTSCGSHTAVADGVPASPHRRQMYAHANISCFIVALARRDRTQFDTVTETASESRLKLERLC